MLLYFSTFHFLASPPPLVLFSHSLQLPLAYYYSWCFYTLSQPLEFLAIFTTSALVHPGRVLIAPTTAPGSQLDLHQRLPRDLGTYWASASISPRKSAPLSVHIFCQNLFRASPWLVYTLCLPLPKRKMPFFHSNLFQLLLHWGGKTGCEKLAAYFLKQAKHSLK